jgi:two-component system NarL family sensor kinase
MRRLPIESDRPIVTFAWARLGLTLISVALVVALGFPYSGRLAVVLVAVALPWSLFNLLLARRVPSVAVSPLVVIGDVVMLIAIELVAPESYAAVRFMAIAFLAVHAHFQGERLGLAVAGVASAGLVGVSIITGGGQVHGRLLVFYEVIFTAAALSTAVLVGGFRTAESASRLRARELTRRTMRRESEIRRQISEALHDGPVQEMVGLDMALAAAHQEAEREGAARTRELLAEARAISERNVRSLRDEMIDLGPYALKEMTYGAALERCLPVWQRRYGLKTTMQIDPHELPSQTEGDLFRITQEAVTNAVKHGSADHVTISLRCDDDRIELAILDDGDGFGEVDPLKTTEPGHIGLASMRERAELLHGSLRIESSAEGTAVIVRAPRPTLTR